MIQWFSWNLVRSVLRVRLKDLASYFHKTPFYKRNPEPEPNSKVRSEVSINIQPRPMT